MQAQAMGYGATYLPFGSERAARTAARNADRLLRELLKNGCAPIPCPSCGAYQPKMIDAMRRDHLIPLRKVGNTLVVIGFAVLVFAAIDLSNGKGMGAAGSVGFFGDAAGSDGVGVSEDRVQQA